MADAQYAIDIAANMNGGAETLAQLDEISANLLGGGKNADFFQQAMAQVSRELAGAEAAAHKANSALGEGNTQYAQLEKAALKAAVAAEKAAQKNGGVVPPDFAAKANAANLALSLQAVALRKLEGEAKKANDAETKLSNTQKNLETLNGHVNKSLAGSAESYEKLRFGLSSVGGSLGQVASNALAPLQGFSKLSAEFGAGKATALAAAGAFAIVAVAIVAISVAAVAGVVKIAAWAIGLSDSARSAQLSREALEAMHPELLALHAEIDDITGVTGLSSAAIAGIAKQLHGAKVAAADMPAALRAAALAEAALGNGGAQAFIDQIKEGKASVSALAAETQAKLGGVVAKQLLGLDAQSARFSSNIAGLFGGLKIEPVLSGLQTLVALFDKSEVAGKAVKFLFESIFQPLINHAEQAAFVVEAFYLGALIGGVKLYIALKPALKVVSELFGFKDSSLASTLDAAKKAGEFLAPVFAILAGGFLLVAGAVTGFIALLFALPVALIAIPVALVKAFDALNTTVISALTGAVDFVRGIDWGGLGASIIAGIVGGITSGAASVINAMGNVMHGALDSAKHVLGIASPSKEADALMANFTSTAARSADDGADEVQRSMAAAVAPPDDEALKQAALSGDVGAVAAAQGGGQAPAQAAQSGGGGGGNFAGAVFNFYGVEGADDAERRFEEVITRITEGDAASLGTIGATA